SKYAATNACGSTEFAPPRLSPHRGGLQPQRQANEFAPTRIGVILPAANRRQGRSYKTASPAKAGQKHPVGANLVDIPRPIRPQIRCDERLRLSRQEVARGGQHGGDLRAPTEGKKAANTKREIIVECGNCRHVRC